MATAPHGSLERRRFAVRGVVQGVGFRPFVHRLAHDHGVTGFVLNDGAGVVVEAEGEQSALERFAAALKADAPALARVETLAWSRVPPRGSRDFVISPSVPVGRSATVPPDVATCGECLRELFDPADRRFRHPFISCTQCGPRFTVVRRAPYDRAHTTMAAFAMCGDCRREYEDPRDRRFHAELIACPACGPRLDLPLPDAVAVLREGGIVAVKGLGGWHLACDAADEAAVRRLRERKHRDDKPFAVMTAEPDALAEVAADRALLEGPERPIVLLRRRPGAPLAPSVSPRSPLVGVMLPYTPVHHLLIADAGRALVMTSGNRTDEPIAVGDAEARSRLGDVADAFLGHDRPIHRRCEDSVVRAAFPIRRSRGHVPRPLALPVAAPRPVLAVGAELKSTFCLARRDQAHLSPHLGDLDDPSSWEAWRRELDRYLAMLAMDPSAVACDLHPDYLTARWAREREAELVEVQHHHAHAAACLAENGVTGPALALVFDGTGLGTDGTLWGGELLRCDLGGFERVAHLDPMPLPGGEAAIREPWRMAAAYLEAAGRPVPFERWPLVRQSLRVNAPRSSGMGRLFDAVAALLGVRERVGYEGQAAVELEHLAGETPAAPYPCFAADGRIRGADLVRAAHDDLADGRPRDEIAAAFHEGVAAAAVTACELAADPRTVALSGGSFQNVRLLTSVRRGLQECGFRVLAHRRVPPNDAGISYGQAAVAAWRLREGGAGHRRPDAGERHRDAGPDARRR
jgi:hydrogenase maturation protein HypF